MRGAYSNLLAECVFTTALIRLKQPILDVRGMLLVPVA